MFKRLLFTTFLLSLLAFLFLSGCSTLDTAKVRVESVTREAVIGTMDSADKLLELHEVGLCTLARKGALDTRYGMNDRMRDAYTEFCDSTEALRGVVPLRSNSN